MKLKKTCITVDPGICGFPCKIEGWLKEKRVAGIRILDCECEMIEKLSENIEEITLRQLFLPMSKNPIFLSAQDAGVHLACPIPSAMVKTLEVTLGLAVPKDISILFHR